MKEIRRMVKNKEMVSENKSKNNRMNVTLTYVFILEIC